MNLPDLGGLPNLSPPFTPASMTSMAKVTTQSPCFVHLLVTCVQTAGHGCCSKGYARIWMSASRSLLSAVELVASLDCTGVLYHLLYLAVSVYLASAAF